MLRKRIIFSLIYSNGYFMQSRNFRLQKVGDFRWLEENYKFHKIATSLDELIILNASRSDENYQRFSENVKKLSKTVFIPVSAGGKIQTFKDIESLFKSGADKIVFNTKLHEDPKFIKKAAQIYGAQSIVASVDFKNINNTFKVFIDQGQFEIKIDLFEYISKIESLGVGEIYLNSIDRDGTGFGYDLSPFSKEKNISNLPIILSGGAGKTKHFDDGLKINDTSAVATANLFNFMGEALIDSRKLLLNYKQNLAIWK